MKETIKEKLLKYPKIYRIVAIPSHILVYFKMVVFKIVSIFFLPIPIKNRIVISNYKGKGFYDNPKYVVEVLSKKRSEIEIIWLINDLSSHKIEVDAYPQLKFVRNNFFNQLKYLSTSKIWIDTSRKLFFPIKQSQIYIQFWHGGLGLKKVEGSLKNSTLIHRITSVIDTAHTDIMISNSNHLTNIYRNDFNYKGPIYQIGYPMNDVLVKKERTNGEPNKVSILYAPTFRGDEVPGDIPDYFPNLPKVINELFKKGMVATFLVRMHPSLELDVVDIYDHPQIKDGNSEPDIKNLIRNVDIVISDYSSSIFDCVITNTPGIIFAKDYHQYSLERGLYYELEELPFPYSFDEMQLIEQILSFNDKDYEVLYKKFAERMGLSDDGNSGERFYQLIKDILNRGTNTDVLGKWENWIR